ncbi:MAG: hypothetical protein KF799_14390 [Bdellovibrionales bacterium]|nr:hypothetical protein [Bdellovibrionales bacterium]
MQSLPANIRFFTTADGSPTLAFAREDGYVEKMHHSGGALSESLYIYQQALALMLAEKRAPRVLSLGLGLGYNELISLAEFERSQIKDFKIYSFEALPVLRDAFRAWAASTTHLPDELGAVTAVVAQAAAQVSRAMSVDLSRLRELTAAALNDHRLELRGAFPDDLAGVDKINTVYYDAYSKKMDAGLWLEEVIISRMGPSLDECCVLATYAATGALNRAVKALGFRLFPKAGFQGKRQSTLALKGILN